MTDTPASTIHDDFEMTVNGEPATVEGAWPGESLLYVLRERLGLYGTKGACEEGECGSCSVTVDGRLVCACLVLAASCAGSNVGTVEGLGEPGAPTDVQRAFVETGGVQCGFCTPGLVVAAHALLDRTPEPSELEIREALSGNICRCTGYGRIIEAVVRVSNERSRRRAPGGPAPKGSVPA